MFVFVGANPPKNSPDLTQRPHKSPTFDAGVRVVVALHVVLQPLERNAT
jgi:hypothetical protein